MKELQRKQRIKQLMYSVPSLCMLAVLTFFIAKGAFNIMMVERESAHRVKELEAKAATLSLREKELEEDINKLGTEEGILEEIKEKFSVTREGEYVAIIVEQQSKEDSSDKNSQVWYKRLWDAIIFWK
jgi:cell division protein FtsB